MSSWTPTTGLTNDEAADLLGQLELVEDPLLAWGVFDGQLAAEEVERIVERWLGAAGRDPDQDDVLDVLDQLVDMGLLVEARDMSGTTGYRTRMAEHLRLMRSLRQLFPGRGDEGPAAWRAAKPLVDGIRYVRRPRRYPVRDQDAAELVERVTLANTPERDVLRSLTAGPDGKPWELAGFQVRATEQITDMLRARRSAGAIVGAGTGSGKTLAFYLPAFTHVAGTLGGPDHTRVVALYPRNELLKDQLQSAVAQAVRLRPVLAAAGQRPVRIGALFGAVPHGAKHLRGQYGWKELGRSGSYLCPYLTCPGGRGEGCGGDLVVDEAQLKLDEPSLRCVTCGATLPSDVFVVTREQLRRRPPDMLFSSMEMLNRSLLDPSSGHVFGIGANHGPSLVLLDEVHTYGGASGAMTALTLRRWTNRIRSKPVFVGLSATLLDAPRFFADLVGLHADRVTELTPAPEELIPEGAEYLVIVRSDPTSGAAVLSTTIQTAMLLGRTLDAVGTGHGARPSRGIFGGKAYLFTDDLDVTNRLYFDLLDAEGQWHRRGPNQPYKPSLAHLRSADHPEAPERRHAGQTWELALRTGRSLDRDARLQVGRTSSQDKGIDTGADVVVATASLEVGVDDPDVGAVLQHKAPRDPAAFLQRKGRAGRARGMRPITTVVVSDFGRDREAYERWDQLVDPVLDPPALPVGNIHVLRMQAALETLAWAGIRAGGGRDLGNLWNALKGPSTWDPDRRAAAAVSEELRRSLDDDAARRSLAKHLEDALRVDGRTVRALLWEPPRSILLGAVPALLRRIEDGWRVDGSSQAEDAGAAQPLPSFIPSSLFAPLALPEVLVELPGRPDAEPPVEQLGVVQALRELAPGRITKRFAVESDLQRAWVPVGEGDQLDVASFVALRQSDGTVEHAGRPTVPLVRPLRMVTTLPPEELNDSSHGRLRWRSQLRGPSGGLALELGDTSPLAAVLGVPELFLHRDQRHVEARRGATHVDVSLRWRDGSDRAATIELVDGDDPVALGATFDVDGLRLMPQLPDVTAAWAGAQGPALRTARFRDRMLGDSGLDRACGSFVVERLVDLALLVVLGEHVAGEDGLAAAVGRLGDGLAHAMAAALPVLLVVPETVEDATGGVMGDRIREALDLPDVVTALLGHVRVLVDEPDATDHAWIRRRLLRTVGEAFVAGASLLCPDHDRDRLVVDVEPAGEAGAVWISEQDVGGGGFLEALTDAASADPQRFVRLVGAAVRPGADDIVAGSLERAVAAAVAGGPVAAAFAAYRSATSATDQAEQLRNVREALLGARIGGSPQTIAALANRLLRSGSSAQLDADVDGSLSRWRRLESESGVEVPVRVWTLLDSWDGTRLDLAAYERRQLVLWPRGSSVRDRRLATYNPFAAEPDPAPELLLHLLEGDGDEVVDAAQGWDVVGDQLASRGSVRLAGQAASPEPVLDLLARSAVSPVDVGFLRVHAHPSTVRVDPDGSLEARLDIPDLGVHLGQHGVRPPAVYPASLQRRIHTMGDASPAVADLLHTFFVSELLQPSSPLWIVSAWLSDVPVVDNRAGDLIAVAPALPTRRLRLVEVLTDVVARGGDVRVVVKDDGLNTAIIARLRELESRSMPGSISVDVRPKLHDKVLLSDRLHVDGSMNLTHNGSTANEEGVSISGDPAYVAQQRLEIRDRFGGGR